MHGLVMLCDHYNRMENIYLPNKLACRIIELEVTTHKS